MNQITRFFWWCGGVHRETLVGYPYEQHKYVGIGATIFFTGLFAALSGGYALYFVFSGNSFAGLYAFLFGLLWGLTIFNMDRYIVASINKNTTMGRQLLQASPRILLAILIGIVISRPLELKIFDKEIRQQLAITYLDRQRANIDTLNQAFESKYALELGKLTALQTEREALESSIKADRIKLNQETFGDKTPETSGIVGYGPYAKKREAALEEQEQYLDTLRMQIQRQEAFIRQRKQAEGLLDSPLLTGTALDSLVNMAGFADRNEALGDLKYHADGRVNTSNYTAITFIMLLFVFFECLPVLVKLMSARDAYDAALSNQQAVDFYRSADDRKVEMDTIDGMHDQRVQAGIDKEKRALLDDY